MITFEERNLELYAEPVKEKDLILGESYFFIQFIDRDMYVPEMEAYVYIGKNIIPEAGDMHYFQDAESHRDGVVFPSKESNDKAIVCAQPSDQLKHIFTFEKGLNVLLLCSIRRSESAKNS